MVQDISEEKEEKVSDDVDDKLKVLLFSPILSRSGYGHHARIIFRALKEMQDKIDLYLIPLPWGKTAWLFEDSEEREEIDALVRKTVDMSSGGGVYDLSIQCTVPNEWKKMADINIGATAGCECTKMSAGWLNNTSLMDKIVVPSNFVKDLFLKSTRSAKLEDGREIELSTKCLVDTIPHCVFDVDVADEPLPLDLKYDKNFLVTAQWGPRKNLDNVIRSFVREFKNDEVGLILKVSLLNESVLDREHVANRLSNLINEVTNKRDTKCQIALIHGYMSDGEMRALYQDKRITALVQGSHGESFGLPEFEAAMCGLPVITCGWGGHNDFLYIDGEPMFQKVEYNLDKVQPEAVWPGVIEEDASWIFPKEDSLSNVMRDVFEDNAAALEKANRLKEHLQQSEFTQESVISSYQELIKDYLKIGDVEAWLESFGEVEV